MRASASTVRMLSSRCAIFEYVLDAELFFTENTLRFVSEDASIA